MNTIPNRLVFSEVLLENAIKDRDIVVVCSDSRGSSMLTGFAEQLPKQFVEVGIAEQSLVSVAAGLASCGKKVYAVSPASFLTTRSLEQIKVDVAYNNCNVKLIGVSGGISYGALGITHHSTQDIANTASIAGLRVYIPSDRYQTRILFQHLINDCQPAYIRMGRNAVEDVYSESNLPFCMDKATTVQDGTDVTIIACGEMVSPAKKAGEILLQKGISARVIDMYCIKPIDSKAVMKAVKETKVILTIEEHSVYGGMGTLVGQITGATNPIPVINMALPDEVVIAGNSKEVFNHYGLNTEGIILKILERLDNE